VKMPGNFVGRSVPRVDAMSKVTGTAQYVDDISLPGMIYGTTIRSSIPRGTIRSVSFDDCLAWQDFTVVHASDIPGKNVVSLIFEDQPYLAASAINHSQEPILLLAHPDKELLVKARRHVHVQYDPLPAIFDIDDSLAAKTVVWGDDNVFKRYTIGKGDVDSVWTQAAFVIAGEYSTGAQEQLYIEPNGVIAAFDTDGTLLVRGSMQCPFYVQKALIALFALPSEKVRVIQQETGGAFGGKEEYPSMLAGHAALLAMKSGRPVKMIYDREEDMAATTKRHPSRTRHKTAVSAEGRLLAMDVEFMIDGGAYATLSSTVLSRGTIHAAGPYKCDNVRVRSTAVATNVPPHGAFRGFGAPQSLFALERHMDKIAKVLKLAPEEFRERNLLQTGDTTATGQVIKDAINLPALQEKALKHADYFTKRELYAATNPSSSIKRGVGFSTFFHGSGFTGSGERYLQSVVELEAQADGRVKVFTSMTEMGQGTTTILSQIAAESIGVPIECIEIVRPDTAQVPNSGPTVASRTAMVVGKLVQRASENLKVALKTEHVFPLSVRAQYEEPPGVFWDDAQYRGEAYGAFSYATYVADVAVDTLTGEVHVCDFVACQEVGRVLNPTLATGQIEGGVAQGVGLALYEKVVWRDGVMANNQMTNYVMPTSMDVPSIRVFFDEITYEHGAMGAKGIGELPMDGPAPAILNAIEAALGIAFDHVPLMPEDIVMRLHSRSAA
jgi:CO/xanthine dehydrogenase Mo-binding subunit